MSKVVYVGHYAGNDQRFASPAGQTLMEYVIEALSEAVEGLTVLSFSRARGKSLPREERMLYENVRLISAPSDPPVSSFRLFTRLIHKIRRVRILDRSLESTVEEGDTVIVYHSLELMRAIRRLKRKKKIRLVLQVCEIYGDVINDKKKKTEELAFFKAADAYIFSSSLLEKEINTKKAPCTVCLGTYHTERERSRNFASEKVHCVYAGTFDPRKGGAITAIEAAEYLPEGYHLHILGFGNGKDTAAILQKIDEVSRRTACMVTYDGCLAGKDYLTFIQSCDIGLSTQNPDADFNATSFPSKILSYMANGLCVVSIRIPAVESSAVGPFVYYYDTQTPLEVAKAIEGAWGSEAFDGRTVLQMLDKRFKAEIKSLLEK